VSVTPNALGLLQPKPIDKAASTAGKKFVIGGCAGGLFLLTIGNSRLVKSGSRINVTPALHWLLGRIDTRAQPCILKSGVDGRYSFERAQEGWRQHQRCQRQRIRCHRRPLVEPLQFDMFRHGVDLLALGLRFATSSLVA
jgi:hypothetical protein